jgi:hypothetical protein
VFVRIKRVNGHDYVYLVENIREGGRHLQRVIKTLGRRDQVEAAGLLDQLAISAARHTRRTLVLPAFHKGELAPLRRESIGPDLVFGRLWEQTGCGPVPRRMAAERGFAFDLERAVYASVLHRLMVSGSDRHAEAWTPHCRIPSPAPSASACAGSPRRSPGSVGRPGRPAPHRADRGGTVRASA